MEKTCKCDIENCKCDCHQNMCYKRVHADGGGGVVYGLGMIGAAIYFIGSASTFWLGVLGFLKAIVWPAFIVLEAFKALLG